MTTISAQDNRSRFCVSCGRAIVWDANFCPYCGKDYRIPVITTRPLARMSPGMKLFLYYLAPFPVLGMAIGAWYYRKPDPDYREVGKVCLLLNIATTVALLTVAAVIYIIFYIL